MHCQPGHSVQTLGALNAKRDFLTPKHPPPVPSV